MARVEQGDVDRMITVKTISGGSRKFRSRATGRVSRVIIVINRVYITISIIIYNI